MIRKNAKPDDVANILDDLDNADQLICAALRTKGLTKAGNTIGRNALHTLRRFIQTLEEEANDKFSGQEWL
jgi:hypothetical protein